MKNTYIDNGLLKFTNLKNDNFQIITTYDNKIWGNMNDYFSSTQEEKDRIKNNDEKMQKSLNTNLAFAFTTPPEPTIIDMNTSVINSLTSKLDLKYDSNFIPIRANAAIVYPQKQKVSYIFSPIDCPILVLTNKNRTLFLLIHLGAPQIYQRIYNSLFKLINSYELKCEFDCYVTPYICKKHYSIPQEKYDQFLSVFEKSLSKYVLKTDSKLYKEDRYYFNFFDLGMDEIKKQIDIKNIYNTDICTYEETKKGHLFSHEYMKELNISKEKEFDKYNGAFNVIVNI